MKQRQVAARFHPGECLCEEIKAREWTQMTFVSRCYDVGLNDAQVWAVLRETLPINKVLATGIAQVLGTSVRIWLNLQKAYDDWEPNANA